MTDALREQIRAFILENYLFTADTKVVSVLIFDLISARERSSPRSHHRWIAHVQ